MNKLLYVLIPFCLLLSSCNGDEECRKSKYTDMEIGFYHVAYNETTKKYTTTSLSVDSLTVQGLITDSVSGQMSLVDSLLYDNKRNISTIYVPLNKVENISRFVMKFKHVTDTLTIIHTNTNEFLSLECGCIETHFIDNVLTTNNFIDSVRIIYHDVNTTTAEHIRIYN